METSANNGENEDDEDYAEEYLQKLPFGDEDYVYQALEL